ncbi:hypothetical protein ACP70R_028744 [Stipagrostis hirtigluma subsp. patula]
MESMEIVGGGHCRLPDSTTEETSVPHSMRIDSNKRKTDQLDEDDDYSQEGEDGVQAAGVVDGSKHRDGSIYRQDTHFCHRLYRLNDTRETHLLPSNRSDLDKGCCPNWPACRRHNGCAMMQIFSLKLVANHGAITSAGPIHLYGFMAVRDLLHPLRNYVFNRSRDDPLILHPDPEDPSSSYLIQMTGPKRGIYLQARALVEFDMRIKMLGHGDDKEDLELIDGFATFSELTPFHGVYTQRIHGDGGAAVDISLALLRHAVQARMQVGVSELPVHGISLCVLGFVSGWPQGIKLFDGVVHELGDLDSFVVAVVINTPLILHFLVKQADGSDKVHRRCCAFPAKAHGCNRFSLPLDFADIKLKVFWANLPY